MALRSGFPGFGVSGQFQQDLPESRRAVVSGDTAQHRGQVGGRRCPAGLCTRLPVPLPGGGGADPQRYITHPLKAGDLSYLVDNIIFFDSEALCISGRAQVHHYLLPVGTAESCTMAGQGDLFMQSFSEQGVVFGPLQRFTEQGVCGEHPSDRARLAGGFAECRHGC